ncbi:abortive infection family protein [Pseudomonas sp. IPO3774]|uniref:abortive infection family protein n=1 Tax=Pseudomonas sp. IPO3774 TaxID=2738826 RepID=UPI0015A305B7|nr:abortive infection family protein [Pseudomonas sp. IPO3774]NWD60006.1 abortive infection family protein [Pseudomonas sp. IPO3774]
MSEDGFLELAARSAKVKNENLQLLHGLRAFEQKLLDLVEGLGCGGNSETIAFDEILDHEGDPIGHTLCYLAFTGRELKICWKEAPRPSDFDYWNYCSLEEAGTDMQRRVSDHKVLNSLVADLLVNLEREYLKTASAVQSLSQFVTVEKTEIDADLDGLFSGNTMLLDSWLKARGCVLTDPELSITLSCSHIETVLKGCLRSLGESGYEKEAVERLSTLTMKALKASGAIDENTSQMLRGTATIFQCVGASRNDKSVSHGKSAGYVPPSSNLAQTINHLAGVASVFVMKQTDLVLKGR